jgi:hypothetical protein
VNVWGTILFTAGLLTAGVNLVASFRSTRRSSPQVGAPAAGQALTK